MIYVRTFIRAVLEHLGDEVLADIIVSEHHYKPRENESEEEIASEEEEMDESNSDPDCPTIVVTKAEKDCNVSSYIVNFSDIKDMKELREKQNEESGGDTKKKPRLSWNPEMHLRFVQAVNKLGYDSKASSYPFLQKT
nr:two-component response regulator ARR2-like [Ipomoea batatas]